MFDLAPKAGNPRNSEGSFLRLNDGRIAFAYSRYSGNSADDHAYAEIACIFSSDNGETFGDER
ncbi:MAG: exo-alpha-sialidase, partial [Clostridia bacterium]|nr:exo-alpha-sialidase [Clostridia bacterium]